MEGAFKDLTGYLWGGGGAEGLVLCANGVYGHGTLLPDL